MNQKNILPYDGSAYFVNDTNGEFEWPEITASLAEIVPWRIETARLFGRDMSVPRMTAWFGDAGYTYSGIRHRAAPFPAVVQRLRERAEAISGAPYNAVLLNLYRNGSDVSAGIAIMRRVSRIVQPSPACRLVRRGASNFDTGERRRQSRLKSVRDFGWSWLARLSASGFTKCQKLRRRSDAASISHLGT
jgi:hypothetical protein